MNETNAQIEKIKKTSKNVLIVTNIVKVILIVSAVITLIAGIFAIACRDPLNKMLLMSIDNENMTTQEALTQVDTAFFNLFEGKITTGEYGVALGAYLIAFSLLPTLMAVLLHFIGRVFKTFRESYSPFVPEVLKELKVAFILIALLTFSSSAGVGIVVSLALWSIYHIFEYGCELQKQSDETL